MKMMRSAAAAAATAAFAVTVAPADATTRTLNFTAPGASGTVELTYGTTTDAKYPSATYPETAYEITGIVGTFSDSNNGLTIVNAPIVGLYPLNFSGPADPANVGAPADMSSIPVLDPSNLLPFGASVSYDNLYWPGGAPITAWVKDEWAFFGGPLDVYGVMFRINVGTVADPIYDDVDLWYNGAGAPVGLQKYGVVVLEDAATPIVKDYVAGSAPEPSTWAMMVMGFAALGFVGHRAARRRTAAA